MAKLSARQEALLERVCLRRYEVQFDHYMGSFQPNESVTIYKLDLDGKRIWNERADRSFRPATAEALRSRGLVQFLRNSGPGFSIVVPTRAGLELYLQGRKEES
jgi:hypothetical protein